MFQLPLNTTHTELSLLCFSLCSSVRQGGDTARTADPNRPKAHSIPYNVMLSLKTEGSFSKVAVAWRLTGHQFDGGECFASFVTFFFLLLIVFIVTRWRFIPHSCLSDSLPHPAVVGYKASGWRLSCWPESNPNHTMTNSSQPHQR